jgi:hypothetical protein
MYTPFCASCYFCAGADPGFQVRGGAHLKNCVERWEARQFLGYFVWKNTILRQKIIFFPIAEGGAKNVGVFRVKNHDFTPKNVVYFWSTKRHKTLFVGDHSMNIPTIIIIIKNKLLKEGDSVNKGMLISPETLWN